MIELKLQVLTPEKEAINAIVDSVYLEGSQGRLGILPGHTTLIANLSFGILELDTGSGAEQVLCGAGLVEVSNDTVTVLVRSAERGTDIDVERAKAALNRARSRRDSNDKDVDMIRAEAALLRALQRLQFAGAV